LQLRGGLVAAQTTSSGAEVGSGRLLGVTAELRPWASLALALSYDRAKYDWDASTRTASFPDEWAKTTQLGLALRWYPLSRGLFDPYLGAGLVQIERSASVTDRYCDTGDSVIGAELSVGLELWLTPWLKTGLLGTTTSSGGSTYCAAIYAPDQPAPSPDLDEHLTLQLSLGTGARW